MTSSLPPEAWAASLPTLPGLDHERLRDLLALVPPEEAWAGLRAGRLPPGSLATALRLRAETAARLQAQARARAAHIEEVWTSCLRSGIEVRVLGHPGYPEALAADHAAPAVLFSRGDLGVLAGPRVGIVGTRNASTTGRSVATELGEVLSRYGVRVVSGLALGIDGAAHTGALAAESAPPVGVVASGLDVVYPQRHRALWQAVASRGVLLAEVPPGTAPEPFRFPLRNRIIAALAHVLVVVESRHTGGSMITAREAEQRGVTVMAVPGSVRSGASDGPNQLLVDGCPPARDALDVLVALGLVRERGQARADHRSPPEGTDGEILDLLGGEAQPLERLVLVSGREVSAVALALDRLVEAGWVSERGGWYERVAP